MDSADNKCECCGIAIPYGKKYCQKCPIKRTFAGICRHRSGIEQLEQMTEERQREQENKIRRNNGK